MSQSASGASRYREVALVLALVGLILAIELGLRLFEGKLSGNVEHIRSIPSIIDQHGRQGGPAMLVLGNSLTNNGVNVERLSELLAARSVAKVTPDGTSLWDWQCLIDHQVIESGAKFNTVVLGFAWHQLSDTTQADPSRLGAYFCEFSDLKRPGAIGLSGSADIGEFLAAGFLRAHAMRDTLRNGVLTLLIPGYKMFTQEGNRRAGDSGGNLDPQTYSYTTLEAIASRLQRSGSRLVIIAMPVRDGYALDPGIVALADRGVLHLLDYRNIAGVDRDDFKDSMHLTRDGQRALTAQLGIDLAAGGRGME